MEMKLIFKAIVEALLSSVVLIFTIIFALSSFNSKVLYKLSFILIILETVILAIGYFKNIKKISTKQKIVVFSSINFLAFFIFLIVFFVIDIYFPSFVSPKQEPDVSDGIGVLQVIVTFILSSFICRLVALQATIRGNQGRQSKNNQETVL